MGSSRNDFQLLRPSQFGQSYPVKLKNAHVLTAHNEQCWRDHASKGVPSKIRTTTTRDDRCHEIGQFRSSNQSCRSASACAKITNRQLRCLRLGR
jgi:hypothetical protein